ncbi:MAG TPA: DUF4097 family beta strand repeat-containing protein [Bryobacterales bacterium]|nr:DUF4097 family beta strand repeat-containing protein [Bryobacterales bacterium]
MRSLAWFALSLGTLLLSGCVMEDLDLPVHERVDKKIALDPTGSFRLRNVNGAVRVEAWDQNQVEIEAEKEASSRRLLDEVQVDIRGEGDSVDVETHAPHRSFFFGGMTKVDYRVRAPREARLDLRNVNGGIEVRGSGGRARAETVNGSVRIENVSGVVEATTVNGRIEAGYSRVAEGRHAFSTTNGSVTLYLPGDASAEFEAHTVNGRISTEFPLQVNRRFGNHRLTGRLGDGRSSFRIRTVNGSVRLLKGPYQTVRKNRFPKSQPLEAVWPAEIGPPPATAYE